MSGEKHFLRNDHIFQKRACICIVCTVNVEYLVCAFSKICCSASHQCSFHSYWTVNNKTWIDVNKQSIENEPSYKQFCDTMLGIGLIARWVSPVIFLGICHNPGAFDIAQSICGNVRAGCLTFSIPSWYVTMKHLYYIIPHFMLSLDRNVWTETLKTETMSKTCYRKHRLDVIWLVEMVVYYEWIEEVWWHSLGSCAHTNVWQTSYSQMQTNKGCWQNIHWTLPA